MALRRAVLGLAKQVDLRKGSGFQAVTGKVQVLLQRRRRMAQRVGRKSVWPASTRDAL